MATSLGLSLSLPRGSKFVEVLQQPSMTSLFEPASARRQSFAASFSSNEATVKQKMAAAAYVIVEKQLIRRIDWRILPILFCAYFLQFLDKVVYNYANVMGIQKDLHMKGNDFTWGATAFFIGYALAEFPQGALLQRFPVAKVLAGNIFLWGITTLALVGVKNTAGLISLRVLLGTFEAVINPALVMLTAAWYQKDEAAPRFGLWYCGLGFGQIFGGLISFGAQHATGTTLAGWRIMFMCIGIFNVMIASIMFVWLPSTPEEARFLSIAEKQFIAERLYQDNAGNGVKKLRTRSIVEVVLDLQTWILCLLVILLVIPSGVITTYSSILIKDFGYTPKQAALLNMPSGVVSIIVLLTSTWVITKGYGRCLSIMTCQCVTLLGGCLMSFSKRSNHGALLAGIYLVNAAVAPFALVLTITAANYRGYTRKVAGASTIAGAFSIANIIGPQTFQARDAPHFYPAKYTLVAATAASILVALALRTLYVVRNARAIREAAPAMSRWERAAAREQQQEEEMEEGAGTEEGERGFRYKY